MPLNAPNTKRRLGELLIDAGLITQVQLNEALASGTRSDGVRERLGQTLVRLGFVTEQEVAEGLSAQLGLECLDANQLWPDAEAIERVPAAVAERFSMLPLAVDGETLVIACADPTDVVGHDDIRLVSGLRRLRTVVAPASGVDFALRRAYGFDRRADELLGAFDAGEAPEEEVTVDDAESAPMIRLVDEVIAEAVDRGASDIHVEPSRRGAVVRLRIDGVLHETMTVPHSVMGQFTARLKLMASMDIAERRLPQDGRARFLRGRTDVDLRISSLPSLHGETVVLRLLHKGAERLELHEVGFGPEQLARVTGAIERPQGLVLITGPTGSGKTSTLYAGLGHLADSTRNIVTLEDPVEYELPGINQTQVLDRIGRTFARCLRTVLRQDPDIVMVGEIRDGETAELALQAAMTGHMVLSTLHTNDAPSAVVRLRELGVPPYLIASSLSLVIAQRLVRRVCRSCAVQVAPEGADARWSAAPDDREAEQGTGGFGEAHLRAGAGCASCSGTGYRGRIGIFEILPIDAVIRDLVLSGAPAAAIRKAARERGMVGLAEDGVAKAAAGLTTLDELRRVAPDDGEVQGPSCPQCAREIHAGFATCPWCGYGLGLPTCSACDRDLEPGWRVCPDCATPVVSALPAGLPRALVVDDDESVRLTVAAMLADRYDVTTVPDGAAALEAAYRNLPDVVLLDVGLPDLDGYALTRRLRARKATVDVPVVLVTGRDDRETELAGLQAGADDFVTKPLDAEVLLARLDAVLRRGPRGAAGRFTAAPQGEDVWQSARPA